MPDSLSLTHTHTFIIAFSLRSSSNHHHFNQVIDGGSTGSRLHIFEFVQYANQKITVERRGSSRANVPLSAYGRLPSELDQPLNSTHVADHLLPLFEYAAEVIPAAFHKTTRVQYQATAGMRLLEESEQEAVYDALYQGLLESDSFVFSALQRSDIATLSGDLEGFYGAVAANYLQGMIDVTMRLVPTEETALQDNFDDEDDEPVAPMGALDMGGSSTQIVFHTKDEESTSTCMEAQDGTVHCTEAQLEERDFFATSYLSYGVDQFRERLWSTLVAERKQEEESFPEGACAAKTIKNPCANKGFQVEWQGFTLVGSGDTQGCIKQVQRLIPHPDEPSDDIHLQEQSKWVGGIAHPPVRGKFLAMSLYFFTLDSLRHFSYPDAEAHEALNLSWPTPSIQELHNALNGLCSRDWEGDMEEHNRHNQHSFTRAEVLPHRCMEAVYMVTLLKDGFGFHPESRDITFTFLVDGSEVEWSLGMAIANYASQQAVNSDADAPRHNATDDKEGSAKTTTTTTTQQTTTTVVPPATSFAQPQSIRV